MGDENKGQKVEIPDGVKPMFIQASSLEKYDMKTGDSISDTVSFKEFNVVEILEECVNLGFMSDFHGFMKDIEAYQAANGGAENSDLTILVVRDHEEKYGDNFYICITMEAKERELAIVQKEAAVVAAAIAAKQAEEEAKAAAEYARLNAVFVDEPMYAKPYVSAFEDPIQHQDAHHPHALHSQSVGGDRPLMLCRVSRPRSTFGGKCPQFGSRDCDSDNKVVEFRPIKNPDFDTQLKVRDVGLQGPNTSSCSATTQTPWYRPVNKGCQFDGFNDNAAVPIIARKFKGSVAPINTLQKEGTHSIGVGGNPEEEAEQAEVEAAKLTSEMASLVTFLNTARETMEEALQQNETVEIFGDAFAQVGGEESGVGQKGDNDLKELRSFNDIKYSKNMSLSCIDWHPSRKAMLAVSPVRNMNFDDRNSSAGRPTTAHVLLWDFADLIHPQVMLEGPHEMLCFRFNRNPDQHDLIACGGVNGQVMLFNVKSAMAKLTERGDKSSTNKGSAAARRREQQQNENQLNAEMSAKTPPEITAMVAEVKPTEGEPTGIEPVCPAAVSTLEFSHRKSVFDLYWLAPDAQIDSRGNLLDPEHLDGKSYQFMTASGDGQCLVWDIRFAAIAAGEYPHILKVRGSGIGDKKKNTDGEQPPWLPLFRMELKRPDGAGDLLPCRLALLPQGNGKGSGTGGGLLLPGGEPQEKKTDRRSMFLFGTDSGELAFADWRPGGKLAAVKSSKEGDEDGPNTDSPNYVQWVANDHIRPNVSLEPSTFFPTLLLSVSDRFFTLWTLGRETKCFSSPPSPVAYTCGRWSQTRPGVLYVGRQDGTVDIWDLADSSHKPSATVTVSSTRVTSMEFCTDPASSIIRSSGTSSSQSNLGTSSNKKPELLACGDAGGNLHVLEMPRNLCRPTPHERSLMEAFIYREVKRVDYEQTRVNAMPAALEGEAEVIGEVTDAPPIPASTPAPSGDDAQDPAAVALAAEEAAYKELEDKFIAELGLQETELPDHWKRARAEIDGLPPPPVADPAQ